MYDTIIITTAIPRLDLHKETLGGFAKCFEGLKAHWLFNVDMVFNVNEIDIIKNTKELLKNSNNQITIDFFFCHNPNFYYTWKRLAKESERYLGKTKSFFFIRR